MKISVGQKLLVASSSSRRGSGLAKQEVVLSKVGRRWADIEGSDCKIDLQDGWVLNWAKRAIGRWYWSEEDYQSSCEQERIESETAQAWADFRSAIGALYSMPKGLTLEAIIAARELLLVAPPAPPQRNEDEER